MNVCTEVDNFQAIIAITKNHQVWLGVVKRGKDNSPMYESLKNKEANLFVAKILGNRLKFIHTFNGEEGTVTTIGGVEMICFVFPKKFYIYFMNTGFDQLNQKDFRFTIYPKDMPFVDIKSWMKFRHAAERSNS